VTTLVGHKLFTLGAKKYKRIDFEILNPRGLKLKCSHFEPVDEERVLNELPCVIYLHGNSSSRVEAVTYANLFLPSNITFFCFDFSGSGRSDGEYISLGWWEREDVNTVIEHLRKTGKVSTIALWGRSMGAATALLHADRDPTIAGLVLDSPFSSLSILVDELYKKHASKYPGFLFSILQWFVKKSVKSRANFDLDDLNPMTHVDQAFIPAQFIVAKDDDFIAPTHGISLYEKYAGDKNLIQVEGGHNTARPGYALSTIYMFLYNSLQVSKLVPGSKMEIPNISKLEVPKHVIPEPEVPINMEPNIDQIEDEELKKALQISLETYKVEEESRKKYK
jgi:pimeloyl-ACP methyl ester carboxylesterase